MPRQTSSIPTVSSNDPPTLGLQMPRSYDVTYWATTAMAHFGRFNLTDRRTALPAINRTEYSCREGTEIRAGFLAAEASMDFDWIRCAPLSGLRQWRQEPIRQPFHRFRRHFGESRSSPVPTPAIGPARFVPLIAGGSVALTQTNAMLPDLRSSNALGQSNFDNPGLRLIGVGADFDLTPHIARIRQPQRIVVRQYRDAGNFARNSRISAAVLAPMPRLPGSTVRSSPRTSSFASIRRGADSRLGIQESVRQQPFAVLLGTGGRDSDILRAAP